MLGGGVRDKLTVPGVEAAFPYGTLQHAWVWACNIETFDYARWRVISVLE